MMEPQENVSESQVKRRFDSLAQEAFLSLWRTYDRLRILEDDLFQRFDITAQQYNVLRLLRGEYPGRLPTLVLASRLVSRAPDITRMLDKLAEHELIERTRLPQNRRVVEVGITEAGLKLLRELDSAVRNCHQRQLGHLTEGQLTELIDLLHQARVPHEDQNGVWH
jgi:DNA-binding MarR family transcriptional regulator